MHAFETVFLRQVSQLIEDREHKLLKECTAVVFAVRVQKVYDVHQDFTVFLRLTLYIVIKVLNLIFRQQELGIYL